MNESSANQTTELVDLLRQAPDPSGWRAGMNDDDYAAMADWLTDQGVAVLPTHCAERGEIHHCGHVLRVAGCGGCDPSAIEFIIESLMERAEQETAEANAQPDLLTGRHSTLAPFLLVRDIRAAISTPPETEVS